MSQLLELRSALRQAQEALGEICWSNNSKWQADRARDCIPAIEFALSKPEDNLSAPIGMAYEMPGTPVWTMCVFPATDMPAGSSVYAAAQVSKPLTAGQVFSSDELMHLNGSLLMLEMSQLMLLVRAVEKLHGIELGGTG